MLWCLNPPKMVKIYICPACGNETDNVEGIKAFTKKVLDMFMKKLKEDG